MNIIILIIIIIIIIIIIFFFFFFFTFVLIWVHFKCKLTILNYKNYKKKTLFEKS